jgi:hypothetical protein
MAVSDLHHSLLDYERILFCCDWLGSELQIGHFRCPLVNTSQLNTKLFYESRMTDSLTNELSRTELTSRWTEYKSASPTFRVLFCSILCHGNVCYRTFA